MDKNRVYIDQIGLMYLLMIAGGKFLAFPSILAKEVGHDSWLVLCFSFLWDAICLVFLLWAIKINQAKKLDISQILNKTVSKVVAKIVFAVFFVIFLSRAIILITSCYKTFAATFDVKTNWLLFVIPIAALSFFAIQQGFTSIARTSQLLFALIMLSVLALVVSSLPQTSFSSLLPVGEAGWGKIVGNSFTKSFWFSDYLFIYFVFDSIQVKKRVFSPILISFAIGAVLTVLVNAVFIAMYGSLAGNFDLAMSEIGIFSMSGSTNGRWDWLTLSVWLLSIFIKIVVFVFCAYKCVEKITERPSTKVNWLIAAFISIFLIVPMFVSIDSYLNDFVKWTLAPFVVIQFALPLAMPLLTSIATKKTEVVQNE